MGFLNKVLHAGEGRKLKTVQAPVSLVNALEPQMEACSDDELRALTAAYKQRVDNGEPLEDLLPEAFATVREGARRVLGQRHYDVQLMGGVALHYGWVAEMKTGEGKTLVCTLPAYLNALAGQGVHVVTVNDYLAQRDSEWMGRVHRFLGLDVGVVLSGDFDPVAKRAAYAADITYGTNNEFGFDYLRDNMAVSKEEQAQRGHFYAIVDEVDSILIDEARTPLIISGQPQQAAELYYQFARIVKGLQRDRDYEVDEAKRNVSPTEEGIARVEKALGVENLYEHVNQNFVHQLQQALRAKELYKPNVDYIVADGDVKIVDEFTGRILEGRRWSEGLHQAVEAKENVRINEENQTLATVTLQNYFRLYDKLAGMTGTALSEAGEFAHTYNLEVVPIPTHRDIARLDEPDLIYKTELGKYNAVIDDLVERHEEGQPVLVGTISVEKSEFLSKQLTKRGVRHEVLNAKNHEREGNIIAQAGQPGAVTVATNMAGRGVDILLGGNAELLAEAEMAARGTTPEESPADYSVVLAELQAKCKAAGDHVRDLGGLYVLGTERHESRRIDNQLRGRSGRQGDAGESRFYLSLEDELMKRFAGGAMNWVMDRAFPEDMPLEARMVTKAIERAQNTVEGRNFEIRKDVLKYDEVLNEQRKIIYSKRQQILDGGDIHDQALELIEDAVQHLIELYCAAEYYEEWELEDLVREAGGYWPCDISVERLRDVMNKDELTEIFTREALAKYAEKEEKLGVDGLREVERRVMLSVIDQRWREHLSEMDYLREGINLRAMGQRDPLSEWQREGFDMFEAMVSGIDDDFVRYVGHLQVVTEAPTPSPAAGLLQYSAPEDPVAGSRAMQAAASGDPEQLAMNAYEEPVNTPVRVEKTPGRNEPCPCGSGKKYKHCHGA
ncbi:MAG: preprotein translocase subunit SecA [Acidimicrobiia bacterium]